MSTGQRTSGAAGSEESIALLIGAAGLSTLGTWAGAQLAALIHSGTFIDVSVADGFTSLVRLPANAGDPSQAWGPDAAQDLPGPILYWSATAVGCGVGHHHRLSGSLWR